MVDGDFRPIVVGELGDFLAVSFDGLELGVRLVEVFECGDEPEEHEELKKRFVVVGRDRRLGKQCL